MTKEMTRGERSELASLIKERARVAKLGIEQRKAELLAMAEAQLAAIYRIDDEKWQDLGEAAAAAVKAADRELAERCKKLGIPADFRPRLDLSWWGRGENAFKERRAELRKVAVTKLDAEAKRAKIAIDTSKVEILTSLTASGLRSDDARQFLEAMPTVEALMPAIDVEAIQLPVTSTRE